MSDEAEGCTEEGVQESSSSARYEQNATTESQDEDSYNQNEVEISLNNDWVVQEEDSEFFKNLNSIILQYLDISGLDQSYRTFYDECQSVGYLLPQNWGPEPESSFSGIDYADIDRLLKYFDEENGKDLLEVWDLVMNALEGRAGSETETFKLSVYIHIYIALIPLRRNLSKEEKTMAMKNLRDYFQTRTDDCTKDEEVLKYFALPFVNDLKSHPIFSTLLTDSWISELRSRLKALIMTLSPKKHSINALETDLAQLFQSWSESVQHTIELENGHSWTLQTTPHPVTLTSSASFNIKSLKDDNPLRQFFQNIDELTEENKRLRIKETQSEHKYSQLLDACAVLVGYLTEACQGKNLDMVQLKSCICGVFPQMALRKELRAKEANRDKTDHKVEKNEAGLAKRNILNNRSNRNRLSQRQNVYMTHKLTEDSKTKDEDSAPPSNRARPRVQKFSQRELDTGDGDVEPRILVQPKPHFLPRIDNENQFDNHHRGDFISKNDTTPIQKSSNYNSPSTSRLSSTTSSQQQVNSVPNKTTADRNENKSGLQISCSENALLEEACNTNRPRTYELVESSTTSYDPHPSEKLNMRSSRHSQNECGGVSESQLRLEIDDCQRYFSNTVTGQPQFETYFSPGRRTYRVRVVEAASNHVNNTSLTKLPPLPSPVKKTMAIMRNSTNSNREIDTFPSTIHHSSRIGNTRQFNQNPSQMVSTTGFSCRLDFPGTPRASVLNSPRRHPNIPSSHNSNSLASNSNASWQKVSHTADSIAINSQAVGPNKNKSQSKPRRSLSVE